MVRGKFPTIVTDIMQRALNTLEEWCDKNHLSVNPGKTNAIAFTKMRNTTGLGHLYLYGKQITWTNEVKYLGVILDKELTWRKHQDTVIAKAMRVLGMCRGAYGKTWGLSPRVMRWIYITMVRPIILYGSIVWWPRIRLQTCRTALGKLQRTACLAITSAFRTTPTAALEIILGLPPLHLALEVDARKALHRLKGAGLWSTSKPCTKHTRMGSDPQLDAIMDMGCDTMQPRYMFSKDFKVSIPTREDWKRGLKRQQDSLIWYTDGSKMNSGTGAGVYSKQSEHSESLGRFATVFQAETYAIIMCAVRNIEQAHKKRDIYILSDSQAALKAIASVRVGSRLVLEAILALNKLGRHNRVTLMWVPGHTGIEGNERADSLARQGSEAAPIGPEPIVPLSMSTLHMAMRQYISRKHRAEWESSNGMSHSKLFLVGNTRSWEKLILNGNRRQTRVITGALTGHYTTNHMLHKMGLTTDDSCRACGEHAESMKHLLCECDALARTRMGLLGSAYPTPEEYRSFSPKLLIHYMDRIFADEGG
ncbi:uncharacterized protein LOC114353581 [Ostrinia furnacalis]|uniref:uncharacterized protein LOC114353581 n=1 Tax=Ostrinia furnacalis TaxID=93504 RepID=UPI00103F4AEE|nr:uncharacterized protein LOC114353581 [Ostrinia furnacalis]